MNCKRCNGSGKSSRGHECPFCYGKGTFPEVDKVAILGIIFNTGGRRAHGKLRAAFPTALRRNNGILGNRAYYVWRMARFHGGVEFSIPVLGGMLVEGDPYVETLDHMADEVAKAVFGTDMAAAMRWRGLI